MNKPSVQCPACGSYEVSRHEKNVFGQLTLGTDFPFKEVYYICDSCKEEGDFVGETDKNCLTAEKKAQTSLVKKILENMNDVGITMAMFERVFELPTRTLTRWKNGDFSASSLALLRIIATYPWMIGVAEHKFEQTYASLILVKAAADELEKKINPTIHYKSQQTASVKPIPIFSNQKNYSIGA